MLPDRLKTSPVFPTAPAPSCVIITLKSFSANPENCSFVPAVIVHSPFADNNAM